MPRPPHPLALFSLIPYGGNERARHAVAHPDNIRHVSRLPNGVEALDVGFHIRSKSSTTLATLGRGVEADIYVEGSSIARIQCSFEIDFDTGIVMLYDRSFAQSTQLFGENAMPFEPGRLRKVLVQRNLNTIVGMGGERRDLFQFELIWHRDPTQTAEAIKDYEALAWRRMENLSLSRTMDEAPTDLPSRRETRVAGSTDTLRGDWLAGAQRALAGLVGYPQRLDRARTLFDDSPPTYTSDRSGTTTRSQSPNPPIEEQRRRQERRMQLVGEREASKPGRQFTAQVEEERRRIWKTDPSTNWREQTLLDVNIFEEEACETVKKRWVEQGIWNSKWSYFTIGLWKHEEPESEPETDSEAGLPPSIFFFSPKPQPKPKSDDEKRRIAERRIVREREREASRPYHQFVYQISKERERIQEESDNGEGADVADINTRAYENVKNTWTKRGIWKEGWGILPGISWKHEEPFEEEAADAIIINQ